MKLQLLLFEGDTRVDFINFDDVESRRGYTNDLLNCAIPNFWELYDKYKETGEFPSEVYGSKVLLRPLE